VRCEVQEQRGVRCEVQEQRGVRCEVQEQRGVRCEVQELFCGNDGATLKLIKVLA